MEVQSASDIFSRSSEHRNLKYTTFAGDGDTDCFVKVQECVKNRYDDSYLIAKEESIGHAQKRLGTDLREVKKKNKCDKLEDGKSVGGKNRLTNQVIDRMQNYGGHATRAHSGDIEGMRMAICPMSGHMI